MPDIEAEDKNISKEEQPEVSAPTEIGKPSEGSQKDIRRARAAARETPSRCTYILRIRE